jgi:hypothetical protein
LCQEPAAQVNEEEKQSLVRLVCVSSLKEDQEVVLATKNEKGEWAEFGEAVLRSPFITDWLPVKAGQIKLAIREAESLKEIASFTYPAATSRAIVVLLPDTENGRYLTHVFDPSKLGFKKGTTLAVNYSKLNGAVALGSAKVILKPGENKVIKPQAEANGMFRMLAAYETPEKETVVCYDRYIPLNEQSRDILLLFPDKTLGLRVFSLSDFGPFE